MPYITNADLPDNVRSHLSERAQVIFRKTFNSVHEQYDDEVLAFKIAWAAVKKEYEKGAGDKWVVKK